MCLACVVKKFEFGKPRLRGTSHFGTSKLCQTLFFRYIYLLKKFHVSSLKIKRQEKCDTNFLIIAK